MPRKTHLATGLAMSAALLSLVACGLEERSAGDTFDDLGTPTRTEVKTAILFPDAGDDGPLLRVTDPDGRPLFEITDLPDYERGSIHPGREIAISPDGTRMVYVHRTGGSRLYSRELPDGGDLRLFDDSNDSDSTPVWSPDGDWLAFEREIAGHPEIYLARPDGSQVRQLTETEEGAGMPVWSPDGEHVTFLSPGSWEQLGYIVDANPAEYTPFQIHVVNVDGTGQRSLPEAHVADPIFFVPYSDPDSAQIWSPDGSKLAFIVHEEHQDRDGAWSRLAIYDLSAGEYATVREVVGEDVSVWAPSWSASGEFIMLVGGTRDGTALYWYKPAEAELRALRRSDEELVGAQLSPDDRQTLTGRYHEQGMDLFVFDLERNELITIAGNISGSGGQRWISIPSHFFED